MTLAAVLVDELDANEAALMAPVVSSAALTCDTVAGDEADVFLIFCSMTLAAVLAKLLSDLLLEFSVMLSRVFSRVLVDFSFCDDNTEDSASNSSTESATRLDEPDNPVTSASVARFPEDLDFEPERLILASMTAIADLTGDFSSLTLEDDADLVVVADVSTVPFTVEVSVSSISEVIVDD